MIAEEFIRLAAGVEGQPLRRAIAAYVTYSACGAALDVRDARRAELAQLHDRDESDSIAGLIGSAIAGAAIAFDAICAADERDVLAESAIRMADEIALAACLTRRRTTVREQTDLLLASPA